MPVGFTPAALARAQDVAATAGVTISDADLAALLQAAQSAPLPNQDIEVTDAMVIAGRNAVLRPPVDSPALNISVQIIYRAMEAQRRVDAGDVVVQAIGP